MTTFTVQPLGSTSRIDSLGQAVQRIGRVGDGVGEFRQIANVAFRDGVIGVTDSRRMLGTEIDIAKGQILASHKFAQNISGASMIAPGLYVARHFTGGSLTHEEFTIINFATNQNNKVLIPRFEKSETQDPSERDSETSGYFVSPTDGRGVLYVSSSAGQFIAFDSLGQVLYHSRTLDQSSSPRIKNKRSGDQTFIINDSRTNNLNACADNKYLYILSNAKAPDIAEFKEGENETIVLDIYDVSNGKYAFSIKIPALANDTKKTSLPSSITVYKNQLYILQGVTVCVYSLHYPSA